LDKIKKDDKVKVKYNSTNKGLNKAISVIRALAIRDF